MRKLPPVETFGSLLRSEDLGVKGPGWYHLPGFPSVVYAREDGLVIMAEMTATFQLANLRVYRGDPDVLHRDVLWGKFAEVHDWYALLEAFIPPS